MRFLAGFLVGLLVVALGLAAILATGAYNVAASSPPSKLETRIATFALNKSVGKRAPGGKNPFAASPQVLGEGFAHYKENCAVCHGAPGVDASEAAEGLNPPAPDLTLPRVQARPDGEIFWIVSNGIKMTGMPAFSPTHKPDECWKLVAFLRHLPEITEDERKALKTGTAEAEHHHEAAEAVEKPAAGTKPAHTHPSGTKPHKD
ncbi:MAG TPA: c-type cytochrome [Thermoanaerobaculia bacterium]|nr:c-type cytochrome [Thermoanaerobaculia bacterium]